MARKTRTRRIYIKPKRRRRNSNSGGGMKPIIDGGLAGIGGNFASRFIGPWGHPAAALAVGWWSKNAILKTEGAREAGALIGQMLPFIGGGSAGVGGAY